MGNKNNNTIINLGGNGYAFYNKQSQRPIIQDIGDGDFSISNLTNGNAYIHADDIDDLIILLQEVKKQGYCIDN